ncbi:MAG: DUF2764 family protein [Lachnospiraceae bacterium]|nr:DUF2764 family protein [Lachnospiraceae bacterium]
MAEYYLISQLPSLDGVSENMMLPITEERFLELCNRFLGKKSQNELAKLTLAPPKNYEKSSSALVEAWNEGERNLRLALGKVRADKMKKSFDIENKSLPIGLIKAASTAVEIESPLEAEKFLNRYRLDFLETLRPMDTFSEDFVFYYGLKLKLLVRARQFDADIGETAYRNIYNSILNGDKLEGYNDGK